MLSLLYQLLDINFGVAVMRRSLSGVRGDSARIYFVGYGLISIVLFAALWRYDLGATYEYTEPWGRALADSLPAWLSLGEYAVPLILSALGVSSVVIQFTFPRIAIHPAIRWLLNASIVFDLVTDFPRVRVDADAFLLPGIIQLIPIGGPILGLATWGIYFVVTIIASLVIQSVLFILLIGMKELLPRMAGGRTRSRVVEGEVV